MQYLPALNRYLLLTYSYPEGLALAEVVCIQLKQISKDRRLLAHRKFKLNICRRSIHSLSQVDVITHPSRRRNLIRVTVDR